MAWFWLALAYVLGGIVTGAAVHVLAEDDGEDEPAIMALEMALLWPVFVAIALAVGIVWLPWAGAYLGWRKLFKCAGWVD